MSLPPMWAPRRAPAGCPWARFPESQLDRISHFEFSGQGDLLPSAPIPTKGSRCRVEPGSIDEPRREASMSRDEPRRDEEPHRAGVSGAGVSGAARSGAAGSGAKEGSRAERSKEGLREGRREVEEGGAASGRKANLWPGPDRATRRARPPPTQGEPLCDVDLPGHTVADPIEHAAHRRRGRDEPLPPRLHARGADVTDGCHDRIKCP